MTYRLIILGRALKQLEAVKRWWIENRKLAPGLLETEFEAACKLICEFPGIGSPHTGKRLTDARFVPLPKTRYLIYYRVSHVRKEIVVVTLWHPSRGYLPTV